MLFFFHLKLFFHFLRLKEVKLGGAGESFLLGPDHVNMRGLSLIVLSPMKLHPPRQPVSTY